MKTTDICDDLTALARNARTYDEAFIAQTAANIITGFRRAVLGMAQSIRTQQYEAALLYARNIMKAGQES